MSGNATFTVDANSGLTPISPGIYGVAFADDQSLAVSTVQRWGGDCASTYNWQNDGFNCGQDNNGNQPLVSFGYPPYNDNGIPSGTNGVDYMVGKMKGMGIDSLVTIPTIGWVAKDLTSVADMSGSNPTGAEKQITAQYANDWVTHLVGKFGTAAAGGVKYYQLDNEVDNWQNMHSDVHPNPATSSELLGTFEDYGAAIKSADPSAYVLFYTPENPLFMLYTAADNWGSGSDEPGGPYLTHPVAVWFLQQLAAYEQAHGQRVVDCLDVHYPTAGNNPIEDTRSLWDPNYDENSWITAQGSATFQGPIYLLPRMQQWINANYPGTGICISEYQYTTDSTIGGVVEADALGIFGKYGVKVANFWTNLTTASSNQSGGSPMSVYYAFAMYRNYDGAGGKFGDISIGATSTLQDVTIYASSDSATNPTTLWVMIINKTNQAQNNLQLAIQNFTPAAKAHLYTSANNSGPNAQPDVNINSGTLTISTAAYSMNLLVIPKN